VDINDEDNWIRTHRFAGKIWVTGSLLFIAYTLINANPIVFMIYIGVLVIVPIIYSYLLYKDKSKSLKA
jgi:uncharacterized membrane protein